jgi:hypothetical protein
MKKLGIFFSTIFITLVAENWSMLGTSYEKTDFRENITQHEEFGKNLDLVIIRSNQTEASQLSQSEEKNKINAYLQKSLVKLRDISNHYYLPMIVTIGIVGNILTIIILVKEKELSNLVESNRLLKTNSNIAFRYKRKETLESASVIAEPSTVLNNNERKMTLLNQQFRYKSQFSSTSYFILSLALSDLVYNFILAFVYLSHVGINLLHANFICQASIFISYICSFLSASFTTLFTFQRFMAVKFPLKTATSVSLQSKHVIKRAILTLFGCACCFYSFSLFLFEPRIDENAMATSDKSTNETEPILHCLEKKHYEKLVNFIDLTFDNALTFFIPSISIIFMNMAICLSLSNTQKSQILNSKGSCKKIIKETIDQRNNKDSSLLASDQNKEYNSINCQASQKQYDMNESNNNDLSYSKRETQKRDKTSTNSKRITKTLLIVSFAFVIFNSPYRISKLIWYLNKELGNSSEYWILNEFWINIYFTSYSINFFLYSFCGKKFREMCKILFSLFFFGIFVQIRRLFSFFN